MLMTCKLTQPHQQLHVDVANYYVLTESRRPTGLVGAKL